MTEKHERTGDQKGGPMSVDTELQRHRQDWDGFVRLTIFVAGGVAVLLILMAAFLVTTH